MGSIVRIRVLGPLRVEVDGVATAVASPSQARLLMRLVVADGQAVGVDALADAIWGEDLPEHPANAARYHVWKLRSEVVGERAIETTPGGYRLEVDAVDAHEFLAAVGPASRATDPASGLAAADAALSLWAGRPYADAGDGEFVAAEVRRLDEAHRILRTARARWQVEIGRTGEAIPDLEALVTEHPYDEGAWSALMTALYRDGRQTDALRAYERARIALGEDVGLEPSPELRELAQSVLSHDSRLERRKDTPSNLPSVLTSFVGRADEMQTIADALRERRFVTIVGPGGAGKTRLAIEIARAAVVEYPDGIWILDLTVHRAGDDLFEVLGETMGLIVDDPEAMPETDVVAFLHGRRTLLVLDNGEHLPDDAARLASRILGAAPEVRILATSRSALMVPGEVVHPIAMLEATPSRASEEIADAPAVRLFMDRASDAGVALDRASDTLVAVVELCRLVDGLPLAIEMVAARSATVQPRDLVPLVEGGLGAYGRQRGADDRHTTMESTIRWSYDLLQPNEQLLLARLAVFSGGFTRDAAVHVCASESHPSAAVASTLDVLVEQSLVGRDDTGRYRLLQPVRMFGLDELRRGSILQDTRRAHAEAFAAMAIAASGVRRGERRQEVDAGFSVESANLRSALEWFESSGDWSALGSLIAALAPHWLDESRDEEVRRWSTTCAPHMHDLPDRAAVWVDCLRANDGTRSPADRLESAGEAIALAEACGDDRLQADLTRHLFAFAEAGVLDDIHPDVVTALFERAQTAYESLDEPWELVDVLNIWSSWRTFGHAPDIEEIFTKLDRARDIARSSGYGTGYVWATLNMIPAHMADHPDGSYDRGAVMALFEEAIAAVAGLDDPGVEFELRNQWAWHLARIGDTDAAAREFRALIDHVVASGSLFYTIVVHTGLAWVTEESDIVSAKASLRSALQAAIDRGVWGQTVWVVEVGARIVAAEGNAEFAAQLLGSCEHFRRSTHNPMPAWDASTYAETRERISAATATRFEALLAEGSHWTLDEAIDRLFAALQG